MKLEGKVQNIIYEGDKEFKIIRMEIDEELLVVKGTMPLIAIGDFLECEGNYEEHKVYGLQFNVRTFKKTLPTETDDIEKYLASGISGIGIKTAEKIVDKFGKDTFKIFLEDPIRLSEIKGITEERAIEIGQEYTEKVVLFEIAEDLKKYDLEMKDIVDIYARFGEKSVTAVEENPYVLIDIVPRIGFKNIDRIALSNGCKRNDKNRIKAAIKYGLNLTVLNGNTYVKLEDLVSFVKNYCGAESEEIKNTLITMQVEGYLLIREDKVKLSSFEYAEQNIAISLLMLKESESFEIDNFEKKLYSLEKNSNIELTDGQKSAIKSVNSHNVNIITGGPGTGKTTITQFIISIMEGEGKKVHVAAPTGKAAKRITEVTGHPASTIHRLLSLTRAEDENFAIYSDIEELNSDILIVDEASMIDVYLMNYIVKAVKPGMKLVLIGDINQLQSVGPGNVLRDLINSEAFNVEILDKIFRQAKRSNIILNAHRVNNGENIKLFKGKDDDGEEYLDDLKIIEEIETEKIKERLIEELKEEDIADFFLNSQILTPTKKGESGTIKLNEVVQEVFNPSEIYLKGNSEKELLKNRNLGVNIESKVIKIPKKTKMKKYTKPEKEFGKIVFRQFDRIMQTKNDYDTTWEQDGEVGNGIFNGEMGHIYDIIADDKKVLLEFDDGKTASYTFNELINISHSYAITIHKSQGSEFDTVILLLPMTMPKLLTRNILYTAMTRAKKKLVIIGSKYTIEKMISQREEYVRKTMLSEVIKQINEELDETGNLKTYISENKKNKKTQFEINEDKEFVSFEDAEKNVSKIKDKIIKLNLSDNKDKDKEKKEKQDKKQKKQ